MYCIDCEWVYDFPIPYEYVLWRAADQLYTTYMIYLKKQISRQDYLTSLGLNKDNFEVYQAMEQEFAKNVYKKNYLNAYRKQAITYNIRFLG